MSTSAAPPPGADLAEELSRWLVGAGIITVALFPLGIPARCLGGRTRTGAPSPPVPTPPRRAARSRRFPATCRAQHLTQQVVVDVSGCLRRLTNDAPNGRHRGVWPPATVAPPLPWASGSLGLDACIAMAMRAPVGPSARQLRLVPISDEIRHEGGCCSPGNATRCCGPCSSALGSPDRADRGDRAQVLDQQPVDGESALA
jgi:hypothetical protein